MSALPPDGAVFLYYEQNQAMMSALLRAFAQALGPAAMAGDRGGTDIHMAFGAHAGRHALGLGGSVRREIGPFGANVHGDADSQMLSYLANGIAVAAEAVEAEVPVVDPAARDRRRLRRPRLQPRRRLRRARSLWLEPRAALADDAAGEARRSVFGVNGGDAQRWRGRRACSRLQCRSGTRPHS